MKTQPSFSSRIVSFTPLLMAFTLSACSDEAVPPRPVSVHILRQTVPDTVQIDPHFPDPHGLQLPLPVAVRRGE